MRFFRFPFLFFAVAVLVSATVATAQLRDLEERSFDDDLFRAHDVTLCHIPPENPSSAHTIQAAPAAVPTHLAHGDLIGECPYECDGPASPVPKTGQTGCWDERGRPIDCAGTGQNGEHQMGVSVDPRFTDNGDGTVTDNLTHLIWLKDANCFGLRNWTNALSDANTLSDGWCGLTDGSAAGDWRLPNVKELQSLIDFGGDFPALPPGHPFSWVQSYSYWSSTTRTNYTNAAWYVALYDGHVGSTNKSYTYDAWPVRGGQ